MIYRVVPFPMTLSDLRFQGHSASSICYAWLVFMQLTRDLFAIAKFLFEWQCRLIFSWTLVVHCRTHSIHALHQNACVSIFRLGPKTPGARTPGYAHEK